MNSKPAKGILPPTHAGLSVLMWLCELEFSMQMRKAEMFVTVSAYQAKAGEEDAIIALYEDWQHSMQPRVHGFLSGELLRQVDDSRVFIAIMRFVNYESALALANDPEQNTWYRRVMSLTEIVPVFTEFTREWP